MIARKCRAPVVEHPDQPAARKMVGDTILHDEAQAEAIHAPSPTLVHYRVDDVLVRPHALILTTFRSVTTFLKVLSGYEPTTPLFTSSTQSTCNRSTAGGSDRNNNRSRAKRVRRALVARTSPSLTEDQEAYYVALVAIHIRVYGLGMKSGDIIVALQKDGW
jgi:hypothetical protein